MHQITYGYTTLLKTHPFRIPGRDVFQAVQIEAVTKDDYKMATTAKTLADAAEAQLAGDDARGDDNITRDEVEEVLA